MKRSTRLAVYTGLSLGSSIGLALAMVFRAFSPNPDPDGLSHRWHWWVANFIGMILWALSAKWFDNERRRLP